MSCDERGVRDEAMKRCGECSVALFDGGEETVVGGGLLRRFPDALDSVELR